MMSSLDNHLASISPRKHRNERLRQLLKPLHHCLPVQISSCGFCRNIMHYAMGCPDFFGTMSPNFGTLRVVWDIILHPLTWIAACPPSPRMPTVQAPRPTLYQTIFHPPFLFPPKIWPFQSNSNIWFHPIFILYLPL